jgi:hypothetical protein
LTGWTQAASCSFSKFEANTAGDPSFESFGFWLRPDRCNRSFATVSGSLLSYVRAPARIIFALALTIIHGGLAIWTWSEFSVFRSDAETIVSAAALTMDDIARNSLDRVDGVLV